MYKGKDSVLNEKLIQFVSELLTDTFHHVGISRYSLYLKDC